MRLARETQTQTVMGRRRVDKKEKKQLNQRNKSNLMESKMK